MTLTTQTALLTLFEIWEVPFENASIKFYKPLVLIPTFLPDDPDEPDENEYLSMKCPELGIDVFAENREDLLEFIYSDICFVWQHFVLVDDKKLIPKTSAMKKNWLAIAEVVE